MLQRAIPFVVIVMYVTVAGSVTANDDTGAEQGRPLVRVLSATFIEKEQLSGISIRVELSNPHAESISFLGYTPDSFGPPLKEGQIAPIYRIEFKRDGEWVSHPLGWCGFGMGAVELPPDTKPTFAAFAAFAEATDWEAVRVGVSSYDSTDTEADPNVVWSEAFANEEE